MINSIFVRISLNNAGNTTHAVNIDNNLESVEDGYKFQVTGFRLSEQQSSLRSEVPVTSNLQPVTIKYE